MTTRPAHPSAAAAAKVVFRYGLAFVIAGLIVLALLVLLGETSIGAVVTGGVFGLALVINDTWQNGRSPAPAFAGAFKGGVYLIATLATVGSSGSTVWLGAFGLLGYMVGARYVAQSARAAPSTKKRRLWPIALVGSPFAYVLLHYWSTLTLLAAAVLALWIVRSLRLMQSDTPSVEASSGLRG
ncbi:MAG: hypothetical protein HOW73_08645 [Polyangiaceae bacterium]|nr:hypothetical protein [Polyangiaceae bacterium]